MYSPGNSVIVNLCMRFPVLAAIAAGCILASQLPKRPAPVTVTPPLPVVAVPAPAVLPPLEEVRPTVQKIVPPLPPKKKKHG